MRLSNRWRRGNPVGTRSAAQRRARRALHDARALVIHRVARLPNGRMHASEAYHVPKPHGGPVPPRCMRYRMRRAVCDVHDAPARALRCIGARWIGAIHRIVCCINMWHRCVLHRSVTRFIGARCTMHRCVSHVAPAHVARCIGAPCALHRRIDACCIGAIHRFVCCVNISHRCVLHRCIGARRGVASARVVVLHRCALHRLVTSACVASAPVASAPRSRPAAPLPCDAL